MKIKEGLHRFQQNKNIRYLIELLIKTFSSEKWLLFIFHFYYFSVVFDSTTLVLDIPYFSLCLKLIRYASYFYIIFYLLTQIIQNFFTLKYEKINQLIIYVLLIAFFILLLINAIITDNKTMFLSMIMMIGFSGIKREDLYQWFYQNQIIAIAIVTTFAAFGIARDFFSWRDEIVRHALGFDYVTNLPQILMFAILYKIALDPAKVSKIQLCIFQMGIVFVYFLTDSRTEFLMSEFIIICALVFPLLKYNVIKQIALYIEKVFVFCFPIYPIMSIILTYLYGAYSKNNMSALGKIMVRLNEGLSNRLSQTWLNFLEDGVSFYGSSKPLIGYSAAEFDKYGEIPYSNFIDNDYMNILFTKGIIIFIIIMIFIYLTVIFLYRKNKHIDLFVSFIILSFGLINPRIFSFEYSLFGIFMFTAVLKFYCESKYPLIGRMLNQ